ncbi:hypothetical protein [Geoanaerobacter pelophilus]|nr:hypothetical protein [Geoanaerobacter pelophilus]
MGLVSVITVGELASHPRCRNLKVSFGAEPGDMPPHTGVAIVFGKDFKTSPERAAEWTTWAMEPGRLLLMVPPYSVGNFVMPVPWEVRRLTPIAGGETPLSQLLAAERLHEFRGALVPLERVGGAIITAGWRKHPASGMVVWTALPLWSLTVLDHPGDCAAWLKDIFTQCGKPVDAEDAAKQLEDQELTESEWTMLLHLCTGPYSSKEEALSTLSESQLFRMPAGRSQETWCRLEQRGLVESGALSPAGISLVEESRYAAYAKELRRMKHG